jgi:hypothetical protein
VTPNAGHPAVEAGGGDPASAAEESPMPSQCDEIDYRLVGDDMQAVIITLDPQEQVIAEAGTMLYMTPGIEMQTTMSTDKNKGFFGNLIKGIGRMVTGESFFVTTFTNNGRQRRDVAFAAPYAGKITPLDGYLDGYFQEIYLDAQSAPIFSKLVKQVSTDVMDNYVETLQKDLMKCMKPESPNYGKAAKRMYNIFRLNGQYEEAAFLRTLFDEPAALLYQVHSLMRSVQEAVEMSDVFDVDTILDQTDDLILAVIKTLEGEKEVEIVRYLLKLSRIISRQDPNTPMGPQVDAAQAQVMQIVNNFFYDKMTALPAIRQYIDGLKGGAKS